LGGFVVMARAVVALSSTREVLDELSRATKIGVEAYTLPGAVVSALEAAARRGARVTVELEGKPYHDPKGRLADENAHLMRELRAAGVDAILGHPLHAKAISADGTLYLDEKNWRSGDLVLRDDDSAEARAIPMIKHEALAAEAELLRSARSSDGVIVESESFGCCNVVYSALDHLGRSGAAPRLLVSSRELHGNARERRVLRNLVRDGVRVRVCEDSEKLAVAGDRAWLGSANATVVLADSDMTDWGLCTGDTEIVAAVRNRIESTWQSAKEVKRDLRAPN
jgi:phosphatidylserine/phosphatidylglycerophosphate/cardiolipin synthase-like enzyme